MPKPLNPKLLEALGLTSQDFEPAPDTPTDRINLLEDAIIELAEIIGGDE